MTQKQAISLASAMRPHALSEELLLHFLGELEGRIAAEVRHENPAAECSPVKGKCRLLSVPAPFDRLYWTYLVAMIDLSVGDTEAYQTSMQLFEEAYHAYACHYQRQKGRA